MSAAMMLTFGEAGGIDFAARMCNRTELLVVERDEHGCLLLTGEVTGRRFRISDTGYVEEVERVG